MAKLGGDRSNPIDMRRVVHAAVDAAFDQREQAQAKTRKRLPAARALLVGVALMTAGRIALGSRGRGLLGSLEQRLAVFDGDRDERDDLETEEDFDAPEAEEELDAPEEEPEARDEAEAVPEDEEDDDEYEDEDEYEDDDEEAYSEDDYEQDDWDEEPEEDGDGPADERPRAGSRSKRRS